MSNSIEVINKRIPSSVVLQPYSKKHVTLITAETNAVFEDSEIRVYHLPNHTQLIEIISFALGYDGSWYWARVVLPSDANCENALLVQTVVKLGSEHGIYVCWDHSLHNRILSALQELTA